ncbi:MAG TPA: Spy/CpxP family protein refolding chaperone [Terriglobales bacterium]
MKSTRTRVLAISAALILAVAVALAQGMHGHGGPMGHGFEHMLGFYAERLDLTSAQQDQIKAIWQKEKPTVQPLMQQLKQFHSDMNKLEADGAFDEAKVRALATQQSQTMIELAVQHARIKSEMVQVLTAEQKAKLTQLQAKHEQRMQERMQHMQHTPEPPSD